MPSSRPLTGPPMLHALAENWWLLLLRGIAAIIFGLLAFFWPGVTLLTLIFLWGAYAFVDGIFSLWAAISGRVAIAPRWWLAIVGVAGVVAGILTFAWPGITAVVLLLFIAAWAIVSGVFEIWGAIQLRKEIEGEWWLILAGVLSIAFGVILIGQPGVGALAVVWLIAWYAILLGCSLIGLSLRLRKQLHPA
jgi:uncharacterized membrane protein HdeD (DUF308 family)